MEKYIIQYKMKINGKMETVFHENITPSERTDTMNVYVEHLTSDKKKAKIFYDKEEAELVDKLFSRTNGRGSSRVLTIKS